MTIYVTLVCIKIFDGKIANLTRSPVCYSYKIDFVPFNGTTTDLSKWGFLWVFF